MIIKKIIEKIVKIVLSSRTRKKTVVIAKFDSIGDYILFRNFLPQFSSVSRFKGYKLVLLGNPLWKDLYEADKDFFDDVIWIKRKKIKNKFYLLQKLIELRRINAAVFLNFMPSVEHYPEFRTILKWLSFTETITPILECSNLNEREEKIKSQVIKSFSEKILLDKSLKFELLLQQDFMDKLGSRNPIDTLRDFSGQPVQKIISEKYFVVSLGAGNPKREYSIENIVEVLKRIFKVNKMKCIVIGTENDLSAAQIILNQFKDNCISYVSKFGLREVVSIISKANFVICNESSVAHLCAHQGVKYFCTSNLNHFGRFHPYPAFLSVSGDYFYPINVSKNSSELINETEVRSIYNINEIKPEVIVKRITDYIGSI